ncbi:MAG: ABC transporter ATP-binding protein [Deltaproteobacteria bacterium]|nr:ABC transporter ATP-binding protein [Deltaproteobacteria bacterium]
MHESYGYMEGEDQGKIRNLKLVKRLFPYIASYKRTVWVVLLLTLASTGLDLVVPYITKVAIDQYILPSYYRVAPAPEAGTEAEESWKNYRSLLQNRRFLSKAELSSIDPQHFHVFKKAKLIGERRFYGCDWDPSFEPVVRQYPRQFERAGNRLYVDYEDLDKLPEQDIRLLRSADLMGVVQVALVFVGAIVFSFFLFFGSIYLLEWISQHIMQDIRVDLFSHLIRQSVSFFDRNLTGKLVTRVTNDVQNLNELFKSVILAVFKDIFVVSGVMIVMLRLNRPLALICFVLLPFVLALTFVFARLAREAFREIRIHIARLNGFLQESFKNMPIIQQFVRETFRLSQFEKINTNNYRAGMKQIVVFAIFMPAIELLASFALALMIWHGGGEVLREEITLGILVAFIGYIQLLFRPIREISEKFNIMQSALASTERIFQLLDHNEEIPRPVEPSSPASVDGRVEFRDVCFSYQKGEPVLNGISFEVKPGQTVALVGATGAGKTSVIHLLERFYRPDRGSILIDGVDIERWDLDALRSSVGLVTQDVTLFSGSVLENIRMNREEWSLDEVRTLMRKIRAHSYIEKLPGAYGHEIGEGGVILSSGERQLLAFARVLVHDPKILILDEATANLDPETEQLIQQALQQIMRRRTTLIVAHRLSTIRNADKIFVIKRGRILESGAHEELMALKGLYYDLNRYQEESL